MNRTVGIGMYTQILKTDFARIKTKVDKLDVDKVNTFTTGSTLIRLGFFENFFLAGDDLVPFFFLLISRRTNLIPK